MSHVCKRKTKRKDGSTRYEARMLDPNPSTPGGKQEISKSFRTRKEANNWLEEQHAKQINGTYIDPRTGDRPFSDLLDAWHESWQAGQAGQNGRLSPNTARRYQSILDKYISPEFGNLRIRQVTHERVQRFINRLASNPEIAPGTVRNVHAVLRTACAKGVRFSLLANNPALNIDLPRARREEMLFLSADEVRLVAEKIDPRYRVLVYVAAYTGLRAGELAGLQRRDVDLLRGVLHVRRSVRDVNGHLQLGPTKTHTNRTVSLPAFLKEMLREHLTTPQPSCTPGGTGTGPDAFVFTGKGGGPLRMGAVHSRYLRRAVAGWVDAKGRKHPGVLPAEKARLRFHDLRHTCAALSIQAGAHPKLIQQQLGHSSITVTLDRYGHILPGLEAALADALDAAFAAPPVEAENVRQLQS